MLVTFVAFHLMCNGLKWQKIIKRSLVVCGKVSLHFSLHYDGFKYIQSEGSNPERENIEVVASSPCKKINTKKGSQSNKRWHQSHTDLLLTVLCDEANNCDKSDKSFKKSSLQRAVVVVNEKYGESYTPENVHNHLRVQKDKWLDILKAKDMSGAGWDKESKTVLLDEETYNDLDKAKSKLCLYINKPIRNYDLLRVVCGDDHAIGSQSRSCYEQYGGNENEVVNLDDVNEEPIGHENMDPSKSSIPPKMTSKSKSSQSSGSKRRREMADEYMPGLVKSLTVIGHALETRFVGEHVEKLGNKLWNLVDCYEEDILNAAYDFLIDNPRDAKRFVGLPLAQRSKWVEAYKSKMLPPNED